MTTTDAVVFRHRTRSRATGRSTRCMLPARSRRCRSTSSCARWRRGSPRPRPSTTARSWSAQGGQPLLLRRLPPDPRRGGDHSGGWSATTASSPARCPAIGKTWEEEWKPAVIAQNIPLKTADWSGAERRRAGRQARRADRLMRHQWWIHGHINFVLLSSSAFCDLYDKVMKPDEPTESYRTLQGFHTRSVDAASGLWALSRTALANPTLKELFETKQGPALLAALDESEEGRDFRRAARRVPVRVRLAQRRRVRPRRRAVAGGPVDPFGQHRGDDGARRERGPRGPVPAQRRHAARGCSPSLRDEAGRRSRHAGQVRRALRGRPVQLPADRGPRLLHRPALHQRVPPLRPRRRRSARRQGRVRRRRRRLLPVSRRGRRRPHERRRPAGVVAERRASFERACAVEPADRAGHPAAAARGARPVHGRPRVPAARHRAAGGEHRPERAQGRRRLTGRLHRSGPGRAARSPRPSTTSTRARSWCAR